ncbi:extracellular solute-binding protein [Paenibacillus daejeonensis]|uniref:extracellular solute-binding protein n=1 Tax=Paenibacillus daejeonensis TaxID=135193 RepID=UPI00036F9D5B|nr:extracellular solute-binding protein [Paenibacillus daejeonensis]
MSISKRKIVSLTLLTTILAGCSNVNNAPTGTEGGDGQEGTGPLNVSITLMGGPKTPDSWVETALEENLSAHLQRPVDLENLFLPGWSDFKTKINLMMGDRKSMPDLLWHSDMEKEYNSWIQAGVLVDLVPFLQQHGKNILNYYTEDTLFYSWDDGQLFRIPGDVAELGSMTTMLRKDWLDALNLEEPTTLDEYISVLRAFTNEDPDGNGLHDTFGFVGDHDWRAFAPFFYPNGVDVEQFIVQEDGSVKFGATMPAVKETLKILQELYAEGVIDPRMVTPNSNTGDLFAEGKVGSLYYWISFLNEAHPKQMSFKEINPDGQYVALEPMQGKDGFQADVPTDGKGWSFVSVTDAADEPDAVVQVLDRMASVEVNTLIKFGLEGEHYTFEEGVFKSLINEDQGKQLGLDNYTWFVTRKDEANIRNTPEVIELFERRIETSQPMREKIVFFKSSNRPQWDEFSADLIKLRDETFYGIIAGNLPIDAFDSFVERFYQQGGEQVEEEANLLYQSQRDERESFAAWYQENIVPYK